MSTAIVPRYVSGIRPEEEKKNCLDRNWKRRSVPLSLSTHLSPSLSLRSFQETLELYPHHGGRDAKIQRQKAQNDAAARTCALRHTNDRNNDRKDTVLSSSAPGGHIPPIQESDRTKLDTVCKSGGYSAVNSLLQELHIERVARKSSSSRDRRASEG